jgi:hypothetical protein
LEKNKHQKWITSDHHHHDQYGKWNKSLQTLTAVESSIINSTMLPQIAILAWLLLGETDFGVTIGNDWHSGCAGLEGEKPL